MRNTVAPQAGTSLDPAGGLVIAMQRRSLMLSMQKTESTRLKEELKTKRQVVNSEPAALPTRALHNEAVHKPYAQGTSYAGFPDLVPS